MKTTISMKSSLIVIASLGLVACGAPELGTNANPENPNPENPNPENPNPETKKSALTLTYVSGHLGTYWDCPENAHGGTTSASGKMDEAGGPAAEPGEAGAFAGDCAEGQDCGGFMNCEDAQLTIRVRNTGDGAATDVVVTDLQLMTSQGDFITALEVIGTQAVGDDWTGTLEPGAEVLIRVDFRGPWGDTLGDMDGAPVHIIMATGDDAVGEITTPELRSVAMVAT